MPPRAPDAELWPGHVAALEAFLAIATQWRTGAAGGVVGLDYAGAQAGLALAGIAVGPARWAEIREIERGAVEALNEGLK